eukprot:208390_1
MMIKLYVESHLLVVVILAIRAVCVIKLYVESTIPTSNLGFCAVSCPDEVLCAVDGDCEAYDDWCCPPFIGQSEGFCLSKELICPDSVSAHAERGLSLEETDMNDWVWNALCVMVFTAFIITVGFVTYYCLMMHCVPSRSVKVKWQKVDNPQSDEEEEELI